MPVLPLFGGGGQVPITICQDVFTAPPPRVALGPLNVGDVPMIPRPYQFVNANGQVTKVAPDVKFNVGGSSKKPSLSKVQLRKEKFGLTRRPENPNKHDPGRGKKIKGTANGFVPESILAAHRHDPDL